MSSAASAWLVGSNAFATLAMVGVIWFVQVVHYPMFATVASADPTGFAAYEAEHQRRTTLVVGPLMLAELITSVALVVARPPGVPMWAVIAGLVLVLVAFASTFAVQVPLHGRLSRGFDAGAHAALVWSNWVRTAAWTMHGVVAIMILVMARRSP